MLLIAVFAMVFGTIVDRHRKHQVMLFASVMTLAAFVIAGVHLPAASRSRRCSTSAARGSGCSPASSCSARVIENMRNIALSTTVTLLVPEERHANANGLVGTVQGLAFLVTSVFSGLSIGLLGMGWTLADRDRAHGARARAPAVPAHPRRRARARDEHAPMHRPAGQHHRDPRRARALRAHHLLDVQQPHRRRLHGADGPVRPRAVPGRDLGRRARRHLDRLHHRRPRHREVRPRPQPDPHDAARSSIVHGRCSARSSRSATGGGSTRSASGCT